MSYTVLIWVTWGLCECNYCVYFDAHRVCPGLDFFTRAPFPSLSDMQSILFMVLSVSFYEPGFLALYCFYLPCL